MESPDVDSQHSGESPKFAQFCDWMAKSGATCGVCHPLQQKLVETARREPITQICFAGLYQTAVPVHVGHELAAFLHTGHIMVDRPDQARFHQVAKELLRLGTDIDLKQAEDAWYATRVLTRNQQESMVRLLGVFAQHLGLCGNQLVPRQNATEPPSIRKAREIVGQFYEDELSLGMIAGKVNVSAGYFSELLKKAWTEFCRICSPGPGGESEVSSANAGNPGQRGGLRSRVPITLPVQPGIQEILGSTPSALLNAAATS